MDDIAEASIPWLAARATSSESLSNVGFWPKADIGAANIWRERTANLSNRFAVT